jgi:chlorophyll(ide) b reductase
MVGYIMKFLRSLIFCLSIGTSLSFPTQPVAVYTARGNGSLLRLQQSTSISDGSNNGGVVITGGANGVGFAYAGEFMDRGYVVVICDVKDCKAAAAALTSRHPNGKVYHIKCDVSNSADVAKLGQFAVKSLKRIQYWINNAGINGGRRDFRDVPISQVEAVVKVNLLGILLCTKVAMSIMEQQEGVTGHIFNTVGSGVKGGGTPGYACYGATKRGLPQLTASLGMYENYVSFSDITKLTISCALQSISQGNR